MIDGAVKQHPVGLGADPRPRLKPIAHLDLHGQLRPLPQPVFAADLRLMIPAHLTHRPAGERPGVSDPKLPGDIPHQLGRHRGGILQKPTEVADGAELEREPKPVRVPAPPGDQPPVDLIEEEEPRQLVIRQRRRESAIVGPLRG
jgi:hypothetical protein